ncbi:leukotriene-B4 omega-hydroxylase 3-like [Patiria miniata]|uniref:Cytochrome P450 n=1 Tax=Patiria miniata TaxID=46514 RepID=A0A913ZG54_PATMI|nr:leukotriene-B4 omega-hydroxylase 3-like [Patiria miniata]
MLWLSSLCVLLGTIFFLRILSSLHRTLKIRSAIKKLPCPPGVHWLAGHQKQSPFSPGMQWQRDTVAAFPRAYTLWRGFIPIPVLVHPDTIKPLVVNPTGSVKSSFYKLFWDWLGEGLGTSLDNTKWKRNRRLLTSSFHLDILRTYVPIYNDCIEVLMGKLDQLAAEGKPMKTDHEFGLCTFDAILRTACSYQSNCQLEKRHKPEDLDILTATEILIRTVQERKTGNPLLVIPWLFRLSSLYPEWRRACQYVHRIADELIKKRKKEISEKAESKDPPVSPRDFLDTLILARDTDGSGLTVKEMTDEVNTFLFAGHETTATAMTWILYNLAKYPEHQSKVREEVDKILENRDTDRITSKDLNQLEYLSLVIKETFRMYSAVLLSRTLTAPLNVDGVTLLPGTLVAFNIYQLHHNPTVWGDDHMEFKPSRFLPENFAKIDPFGYLPFSAGPRNCIGQHFAHNQVKVMAARILRRFHLSLVEGEPEPLPNLNIALKPLHEILIRIKPRD